MGKEGMKVRRIGAVGCAYLHTGLSAAQFRVQVCTPYRSAKAIVALTVKEILEEQIAMKLV